MVFRGTKSHSGIRRSGAFQDWPDLVPTVLHDLATIGHCDTRFALTRVLMPLDESEAISQAAFITINPGDLYTAKFSEASRPL